MPYGCRLQYTLPQGNTLIVHFKDKHRIRHKKRWSQVSKRSRLRQHRTLGIMYLYFLLGWRLNRPHFQKYEEVEEEVASTDERLRKAKENTYILALDGDTDSQPSAVMLLADRLRMYLEVGAACGRIHPTGTGPMVWYQKFEYAVGHWLQKTAEHVFGCVPCSPGCFSLFRAAALMDDNVMKRYTTKPTEAAHYQGWRVEYNAASDSYTNAPQEVKEFYNQRCRWGLSAMANTLDLLSSTGLTAEKNKSISRPYMLYQAITMTASILGTVCLMIAGSFKFVLKIEANFALVLAVVPPDYLLLPGPHEVRHANRHRRRHEHLLRFSDDCNFAVYYRQTFVFYICNALWLVATFFLQAIGASVSIQVPKIFVNGTVDKNSRVYIDPIGLMFLTGFAGLLVIQFFAMLWHS
ncbi:hypothetical protein SRHO_G00255230 [Serrasalmus rhombeus]